MNHAVTIGGLLLAIGAVGGLLAAAYGVAMLAAAMMSDAPYDNVGNSGCATLAIGAVVAIGCVIGMVLR